MRKKMIVSNVFLFILFYCGIALLAGTNANADVSVSRTSDSQLPLDLIFVIDTTGSMWDDIISVKSRATEIVNEIDANISDYRIAVVDYRDFPVSPFGGYMDYPYNLDLAFSSNKADIVQALQGLTLGWGYDWQESVYSALINSINTMDNLPWRCDARKAIILMGDAPPHDPEPFTNYTADSVVEAATNAVSNCGPEAPAVVYSILIGGDYYAYQLFSYISEGTGGQAFQTAHAGTVVETIKEVITVIDEEEPEPEPEPTGNSAPNCDGAIASVSELWPPNHKMHAIEILNVVDPDGDPVTITITGITQDEPVDGPGNNHDPDGAGVGTSIAMVRAERTGTENSRVYKISFTASDDRGASCTGSVSVCVRHDRGLNTFCIDDGQIYDSTVVESGKGKGKK